MYNKNKIVQIIILCGVYGRRLSKITNNEVHKSIIKIGQYPFIYYLLNQIQNLEIKKIILFI